MTRLLQSLSNLFHPLLTLTYVALAICLFTPMVHTALATRAFVVGLIAFYTLVLPCIIIGIMHLFRVVGHWALRDRRDRAIPFFTNFVCYLVCALVLQRYHFFPAWFMIAFYGSTLVAFVMWIVSFWWKISAHAAANASGATYFLLLSFLFPDQVPVWLPLLAVIITGAICSIRLYLGRHTLLQVTLGSLLGLVAITGMAVALL